MSRPPPLGESSEARRARTPGSRENRTILSRPPSRSFPRRLFTRTQTMLLRLITPESWPDIPLDEAIIVIGRHPSCETRLNSIEISRRHCCIMPVGDELEVNDLGSTNGIRING